MQPAACREQHEHSSLRRLPCRERKWRELATQLLLATSRSVGGAAEIGIGLMRLAETSSPVFGCSGERKRRGLLQKPLSLKRRGESTLRQSFRGDGKGAQCSVNQVSTLLLRACALLPAPIYRRKREAAAALHGGGERTQDRKRTPFLNGKAAQHRSPCPRSRRVRTWRLRRRTR